jgi:radical SAM superfamily enzyme with C-terminal helix-hairpin-helix motif
MGYLIDFIGLVLAIIIVAAYTKKLKRKIIYNRYKQAHTLSSREFVFYHHLKKALPKGYHVLKQVRVRDVLGLVKIRQKLQCVELLEKSNKFCNTRVDFIILDHKYRFVTAINMSEPLEKDMTELFTKDDQVEMFLKQLDLKVLEYEFADDYNVTLLRTEILN